MPNFKYPTPLNDDLPKRIKIDERLLEINGVPFQARSDCKYKNNYYKVIEAAIATRKMTKAQREANPLLNELNIYRNLFQQDLWSFVYFVMKNPLANHPFIVEACKDIEVQTCDSLEVWARDHLKSTIITVGRSCQKVLNDPERRIGFFSATRALSVAFLRMTRGVLESKILVQCFPDILYKDPVKEAERWSEAAEGGLIVNRKGHYKEPTFSAWGLTEGMPTGFHLTDLVYDDIVTKDVAKSYEVSKRVKENFDSSINLGTRDAQLTVVGTFYEHDDPLTYIRDKKDPVTQDPLFKTNKRPATHDGSINGKSVFLPEKVLKKRRSSNLQEFKCQQLLDPTAKGTEKLNYENLILTPKEKIPQKLTKFMIVEPAGEKERRIDNRGADAWALCVIGVEPYRDDLGLSDVYILDLLLQPMDLDKALMEVVNMYTRNGRIAKLGVEKVALSTTEIHIASALRAKKKIISVENGTLHILRPGGRSKEYRIESNLSLPLNHGKIHLSSSLPVESCERLKQEFEKFPHWHDDGLDMLSYGYDLLKSYKFPARVKEEVLTDEWEARSKRRAERERALSGWMTGG